jgi:hypothetical protein
LRSAFTVQLDRNGEHWSLSLTSTDAKVARQISRIVVDGQGNEPRCMRMEEGDGDTAIDLLGPLAAKMPSEPTREALVALCTGAAP